MLRPLSLAAPCRPQLGESLFPLDPFFGPALAAVSTLCSSLSHMQLHVLRATAGGASLAEAREMQVALDRADQPEILSIFLKASVCPFPSVCCAHLPSA